MRSFIKSLFVGVLMFNAGSALMADPPGSGWKVIPELTDEFTGTTINSAKWWNYNPGWLGRQPGYFYTNNVSVSNDMLHLTARLEDLPNLPAGYNTYTTAAVKSKTLVKYGYFEIKCRPMKSKASSAFWFYNDNGVAWTEIDVFEICGLGGSWNNTYNMNVHVFYSPTVSSHIQSSQTWRPAYVMADEYHVYAVEWNKDVIKWWADGTVIRQITNTHWHYPLSLNFDSETFPDWFGLPDPATLPSTFSIEYVRSWSGTQVAWTAPSQLSVSESGTMTVTATLSGVSSDAVTVPFSVSGTASASDYTITPSPIIIPAGQTNGTVTITITEDGIVEPNETVILTMGTPTNATLGVTTVHTATIQEPPPPSSSVITYTDSNGLNPTTTPYSDGYVVHTFYAGSSTFSNVTATHVDVLVVGGGGGGGGIGSNDWGAGGGAGGLVYSNAFSVTPLSNYTVTVGVGGMAGGAQGGTGSNSVFGTCIALGGGGGSDDGSTRAGVSGGSGGGSYGGAVGSGQQAGSSSGGFGNSGGLGGGGGGGGGGGAGAAGGAADTTYAGFGGIGRQYSISGIATYYAGGGSGAGNNTGGLGGGGRAGVSGEINGVANTGGGGAGAVSPSAAGAGGSGIVIVRYRVATNTPPVVDAGMNQTILLGSFVPWAPTNMTVEAWFDAADTNTILTSGSSVTNWLDKSGNNRNATQGTGTNQPAYVTGSLNGLSTVDFDGSSDSLNVGGTAFALRNLFVVANAEGGATFSAWHWIFGTMLGTKTAALCGISGNSTIWSALPGASTYVNGSNTSSFSPLANFKVVDCIGTNASASVNTWKMGSGDAYWNGKIAELIAMSGALTAVERQKIEGYLAHKWALTNSLPAGHPYKGVVPGTATAVATLAGSASDEDGDTLMTTWSLVSGPAAATFSDASSVNTTAFFTTNGVYTLRLTVSDGFAVRSNECVVTVLAAPVVVPNVVGLSQVAAGAMLVNSNLVVGTVSNVYDGAVPAGDVISQDPTSGILVADGSAINLVVSLGPKLPATVTLGNLSQTYDNTARTVTATTDPVGLTVDLTYNGLATAPVNVGSYAVTGTVVSATYQGWTNDTLVISQATPVVTNWPTASSIQVGQALSIATLTGGSASVPGSFTYDAPATVPPAGVYTAAVTFASTDSLNYANVAGTVEVTVSPIPLPSVNFTPVSASGAENATTVTVTVALSQAYGDTVTVEHRLATPVGTATPGADFVYIPGTLTFNEGETNKTFTFTMVNDTASEEDETIVFELGALSNATVGAGNTFTYTILLDTADWYALPFRDNFEAHTLGSLNSQFGWLAQNATVQTNVTFGGSAKAGMVTGDAGYMRHTFNDARTRVWTDMRVKVTTMDQPQVPDTGVTAACYVRADGRVMVYDGASLVATSLSVASGTWVRFTILSDYTSKTWVLYVDDVRAGRFGFYTPTATAFTQFHVKGGTTTVDDLAITLDQPPMKDMPSLIMLR